MLQQDFPELSRGVDADLFQSRICSVYCPQMTDRIWCCCGDSVQPVGLSSPLVESTHQLCGQWTGTFSAGPSTLSSLPTDSV